MPTDIERALSFTFCDFESVAGGLRSNLGAQLEALRTLETSTEVSDATLQTESVRAQLAAIEARVPLSQANAAEAWAVAGSPFAERVRRCQRALDALRSHPKGNLIGRVLWAVYGPRQPGGHDLRPHFRAMTPIVGYTREAERLAKRYGSSPREALSTHIRELARKDSNVGRAFIEGVRMAAEQLVSDACTIFVTAYRAAE